MLSPLLLSEVLGPTPALLHAPSKATCAQRQLDLLALIEHTWDVVHVLNSDGTIRYISPSVQRLLGYSPQEMIGTCASDYVHPEDVAHASGTFEHAIAHRGDQASDRSVDAVGVENWTSNLPAVR